MRIDRSTYLKGIVLTIGTHSGPQYVYHSSSSEAHNAHPDHMLSDSDSEASVEWSDSEEEAPSILIASNLPSGAVNAANPQKRKTRKKKRRDDTIVVQEEDTRTSSSHRKSGTDADSLVCGFESSFLAELLCPPRQMCNQRFELAVDGAIFLGLPVHILPSGTWRKLRSQTKEESDSEGEHEPVEQYIEQERKVFTEKDSPMTMFNVTFVTNPPVSEVKSTTDRLYHYVIAQFAKMLRNEQARRNYVWEQVSQIIKLRDTWEGEPCALELAIQETSELARALKHLYEALEGMFIARVEIGDKARAFQVPVEYEMTRLPLHIEPYYPETYPSTTRIKGKEIGENCHESYALLLLDDPERIISDIEVDTNGPVAALIRNVEPTMSIQALATLNNIKIKQMVSLVYSLVYWRRARIIVPLNQRYVYGVSPLAYLNEVTKVSREYADLFPMIPPLVRLLSSISSTKPQPFIYQIPSRDHRDIYMRALAWMVQHNLIVQFMTFGMIVATRKVKLAVLYDSELETDPSAVASANSTLLPNQSAIVEDTRRTDNSTDNSAKLERHESSNNKTSWAARGSSESRENDSAFDELQDSIIADPVRASLAEKKWLNKIAHSRKPEMTALFHRLSKYMNGKDNIEQVMLHENLSRPEMKRFLEEYSENIVQFRHW